jgi:pimeloyl-ACP methyl ester carboxylesterase
MRLPFLSVVFSFVPFSRRGHTTDRPDDLGSAAGATASASGAQRGSMPSSTSAPGAQSEIVTDDLDTDVELARNPAVPSPALPSTKPGQSPKPVRMVADKILIDGRALRFAVSDNYDACGPDGPGSPPIWAVNVHGYFAGGGMYWRESSHLAHSLGWRVLNPSLPGFGGSDPLPWEQVNLREISRQIVELLDHVGAKQVVLIGHSMGGAVAVRFAHDHPERTLGVIYRDGVATPAWKKRRGILVTLLSPVLPDVAGIADLMVAACLDTPDLLIGRRLSSTLRGLWPDARRNLRAMGRTLPVGAMLMSIDMRPELKAVVDMGIPFLPLWGCFDRIVNAATAAEVSEIVGRDIVWVPGGHSWMLPRPAGQVDVLRHLAPGKQFVEDMLARRRELIALEHSSQRRMRVLR